MSNMAYSERIPKYPVSTIINNQARSTSSSTATIFRRRKELSDFTGDLPALLGYLHARADGEGRKSGGGGWQEGG